ncbi:MAG: hypothetical protein ABSE22_16215 [Xanthobacteraceae bacterium]|jgi:hypothetical protein
MAQSPDFNADGEKPAVKAAKSSDANLPMVVSPRLGAGEDETVGAASDEPAEETVAAAAPASSPRFLMLAGALAFAAAFGSFVGSVSGSGLSRLIYPETPTVAAENASDTLRAMKQQLAELATIKASLDAASHNTSSQFAKIADKITDRLDRLDVHGAATAETTGSIAAVPASPAAAPPPAAASSAETAKLTDRVLDDWVVQDVQNGRALIASRYGGMFDVGAGSFLPGVGRIDSIKRLDGQWMVLTARGTITSGR